MTGLLNGITHIFNYAGIGMLMFAVGLTLIVFSIIKLSRQRRLSRDIARAEFNRKFVSDTGFGISDVESGAARKAAADSLGIGKHV